MDAHQATESGHFKLHWGKCKAEQVDHPVIGIAAARPQEYPYYADAATKGLVVKELYPRLLYAFSDVVCFITNNLRYGTLLDLRTLVVKMEC